MIEVSGENGEYIIKEAEYDEIEEIMTFIGKEWSPNHIMSRDREYFEFEFVRDGRLDFITARCADSNELCGILGFLPCSEDKDRLDVFGSIWLVTREQNLGVEMDRYLREMTGCRHRVGIGLNRKTAVPMVRLYIGDNVAKMPQYFILNEKLREYRLAEVPEVTADFSVKDQGWYLREIDSCEELLGLYDLENSDTIPYKDGRFYEHKYFMNPRRDYVIYSICDTYNRTASFIVTRVCRANGATALRIVDFWGQEKDIAYLGAPVTKLIEENGHEYADFYCFGIGKEWFIKGGFLDRYVTEGYVIPNYYEPFERRNVDIWVRYKVEGTRIFKADGDQDRANQ